VHRPVAQLQIFPAELGDFRLVGGFSTPIGNSLLDMPATIIQPVKRSKRKCFMVKNLVFFATAPLRTRVRKIGQNLTGFTIINRIS
jgi:hypothetical protein